jgi:hypothetical protein
MSAALTSPLATEAQAFSLTIPELFFDLYSPPRRELQARERLEQTLRFISKRVSYFYKLCNIRVSAHTSLDRRCLHHIERIPVHPILHASESWPTGFT